MDAKVVNLFIATNAGLRENPNEILVDIHGISNDKFYNKGKERSILISSTDSYELAKAHGIDMQYGSLGENIVIDINPYNLKQGDKIIIGDIELQITQNCTICNSLSKVDQELPKILKNDRGIFAKANNSGIIRKCDSLHLVKYS